MNRTGSLHVLRLDVSSVAGDGRYSITYAPYDRGGGALPAREAGSVSELRQFFTDIACDASTIERVVEDLKTSGRASLSNVVLSDEQLKRYTLQEMGVLQSVISYLST